MPYGRIFDEKGSLHSHVNQNVKQLVGRLSQLAPYSRVNFTVTLCEKQMRFLPHIMMCKNEVERTVNMGCKGNEDNLNACYISFPAKENRKQAKIPPGTISLNKHILIRQSAIP